MHVPASADELAPGFLAAALGMSDDSWTGFSIEPVGVGYGFTSQLFRCRWQDDGPGGSVVVKLWDTGGAGGGREPAILEHVRGRLGIRVAEARFSAIDLATGRGILILEDLGVVRQADALDTLDLEDATALARVLASLHATWWERRDIESADWLPRIEPVDRGEAWFDHRRRTFLERFGDRLDAADVDALERASVLARWADVRLESAPATLVHGDLHLDNVVFDGAVPILLDWARAARGPAEIDLSELVFGIVEAGMRAATLREYRAAAADRGVLVDARLASDRLAAGAARHFIRGTLGLAAWTPVTDRQRRLIDVQIERALAALSWLRDEYPDALRA